MEVVDRLEENWLLSTEIHKIEARIWRKARRDGIRVFLFTSASRGEGKTTTVACLSSVLGLHEDRKILAIDLDFREPKLNTHFGLPITRGLGSVLRGECQIEEAILKSGLPGLDLAFPSPDGEDPALLLKTPELHNIFQLLRQRYDLILMDVPAIIPVADATGLLPLADGVILLAMAGKTTKQELKKARELCLGMDAKILGLIVGNLDEASPGHGYGYYGYGYGRKDGKPKPESG
jgi:protein-tyrosine kinase